MDFLCWLPDPTRYGAFGGWGLLWLPQERLTLSETLLVNPRGQLDQVSLSPLLPFREQALPGLGGGWGQAARGQGRYTWESARLP